MTESQAIAKGFENSLGDKFIADELKKDNKKKKYIIIFGSICLLVIIIVIILLLLLLNDTENKIIYPLKLQNWEAASINDINLTEYEISTGVKSDKFLKAPKEWTIVTAMSILVGKSNDILFGTKLKETDKSQFEEPWWFRAPFTLTKNDLISNNNENETSMIIMYINGINYRAELWIDGKEVMNSYNLMGTFVRRNIDITNFINKEKETHFVAFLIYRPLNQWGLPEDYQEDIDLSISFNELNPEPPDSNIGICQPINIEIIKKEKILIFDPFIITKLNNDCSKSDITIVAHFRNTQFKQINCTILFELINGKDKFSYKMENLTFKNMEEKIITVNSSECPELLINNPKLWFPYEMGSQNFYKLKITLNGNYFIEKKVAIREISSVLSEDNKTRIFYINKRKFFVRGAEFTPDIFLRTNKDNYKNHIDYAKHMNLNTIRLKGKFEQEEFYDLCDEQGIMVMSGFNDRDAWERWEYWDLDTERVARNSLATQLRLLSSHPSVFIFLLGNETPPPINIIKDWLNIIESENWPNEILFSASNKIISELKEETGIKMTGPYFWVPPHYFSGDKDEKFGGAYSFLSEGGLGDNTLRKGSFEKVFGKEYGEKWPSFDENMKIWYYHCVNDNNFTINSFNNYDYFFRHIEERYGKIKSLEDYYKKEATSMIESTKAMFEAYSLKKYYSSGIIYYMLNNAWPSNIWHLYDYFFSPSPAYFAIKKSGEPLNAIYSYENNKIYLINNNLSKKYDNNTLIINCSLISGNDGSIIAIYNGTNEEPLEEDSVIEISKILTPLDEEVFFIHLEIFENNNTFIASNTYCLSSDMDIMNYTNSTFYNVEIIEYANLSSLQKLPYTDLKFSKKFIKDTQRKKGKIEIEIENKSKIFAFLIEMRLIDSENKENIVPVFWEDNYFSLLGESKRKVFAEFILNNEIKTPNVEISGWNFNTTII